MRSVMLHDSNVCPLLGHCESCDLGRNLKTESMNATYLSLDLGSDEGCRWGVCWYVMALLSMSDVLGSSNPLHPSVQHPPASSKSLCFRT